MAVYTRLEPHQFTELLTQYGLGTLVEAREIAEGVENTNYLLLTAYPGEAPQRHILTIFEKRVNIAFLPFYLGIAGHLADRGIPCPRPLCTRDGAMTLEIAGKHAAIVTFLEGKSLRTIEAPHLHSLGAMQARMHLASDGFRLSRPNDLSLSGWAKLREHIGAQAEQVTPGLTATLAEEYAYLSAHWPTTLPSGVIHADLFPDNVFFTDGEVSGVIDFYFACNDLFMYDLVITMNAWCFERDGSFNLTKARSLLTAYDRVRRLSAEERAALPVLARGASLRFLLTRTYDWIHRDPNALVRPHDPLEYLKKLRFHQQVKTVDEYGL